MSRPVEFHVRSGTSFAEGSGSWSSLYSLWLSGNISRAAFREYATPADVDDNCSQLADNTSSTTTPSVVNLALSPAAAIVGHDSLLAMTGASDGALSTKFVSCVSMLITFFLSVF